MPREAFFALLNARAVACVLVLILAGAALVAQPPASTAQTATAPDSGAGSAVPREILLLGPLPAPPAPVVAPDVDPSLDWGVTEAVPEVARPHGLPTAGDAVSVAPGHRVAWRNVAADSDGRIVLGDVGGTFWLVARLAQDRWAPLTVTAKGATDLYVDGAHVAGEGSAADELAGEITDHRGWRDVWVRAEVEEGTAGSVTLSAAAQDTTAVLTLGWNLEPRRPITDFDATRAVANHGDLAISPDGRWTAARYNRRAPHGDGREARVDVWDAHGALKATDLGGDDARPVVFTPDSRQLLLRRKSKGGADLLLWQAPGGPVTTVLRGEPGLASVLVSPDGLHLLVTSRHGFSADETGANAPRHFQHPRQRVVDFTPGAHLHLIEVASGARRRLTLPGDWVLDDAVFLPDGRRVIYGRTVPQAERPWFRTEIRGLDLASGTDELIATFTGGWEVRPQHFAVHPDGLRLAFIGPPDQVGGGRPERNVYHKQVWLLDLASGEYERISGTGSFAYEGTGNLPSWDSKGRFLWLEAQRGSTNQIVTLGESGGDWQTNGMTDLDSSVGAAAFAAEAAMLVYTASAPHEPPALYRQGLRERATVLDAPNAELAEDWAIVRPAPADFTGPGGETIDAWYYPPPAPATPAAAARAPLIVYYYGGAGPTTRGFSTTHQYFRGHGYAVLVINPRGSSGFGDAFADHHAGDWGPLAAADILTGVDAFLAVHPEIDAERIGIYGGSYGGFMTDYLVTETDRFAAAVSMYGISDLATYWGQGVWGWTYGDMSVGGRTPWGDPDYFVEHSPLFRADRVKTPLLLLHGEADGNVTPGESVQLFTALAIQDVPVEMVTFPGEDHGISGTWENRVLHRTMMLEWFDRFLKEQPGAWEHRWN